jgi:hypothetical protein
VRLIFVVSLFAFFSCGIKGSPRPPKSVFVPDEQADAGTISASTQASGIP